MSPCYNSFLPSNQMSKNNLPIECRYIDSANSFKRSMKEDSVVVSKDFFCGNRGHQILYTRLPTKFSGLNNDLFLKRISDSPLCRCGAIENAFHFFLNCQQYADQRAEFIRTVSQHTTVSLQIILFGGSILSFQIQTFIFEAVHKYIRDSKRFKVLR